MDRAIGRRRLLRNATTIGAVGIAGCLESGRLPRGSPQTDDIERSHTESSTKTTRTESPKGKTHTEFVTADGTDFVVGDAPIRFSGANSCCLYMAFTGQGQTRKEGVKEVLGDAAKLGMNAFRTRAHGRHKDFAFQPAPGEYDEEVLKLLDYVLYRADQEGLRLILRLTDSWDTSGATIPQYVEWSDTAESHDDFFTDEHCKRLYREYVETLLTRENTYTGLEYREDPTILMWNLCNEPFADDNPDSEIVAEWVDEMGTFVKDADPNHLVSIGHLGSYDGKWPLAGPWDGEVLEKRRGIDYRRDHDQDVVDVCTFHVHPQELGFQSHRKDPETWLDFVEYNVIPWIERHVEDARELGKPVYAEEVGWKANRTAENGTLQTRAARTVFERLYEAFADLEADGVNISQFVDSYKREQWEQDSLTIGYPEDETLLGPVESYTESVT